MRKEIRNIPKKNYVLVGIISVVTFLILGYFTFWYQNNLEYYNNISVMSGYLAQIQEDGVIENLSNYLVDNPNTLLYVSFGNDASIKDFENHFKDLISHYNINSEFIYIDLNQINDKQIMSKIEEKFFTDVLKKNNFDLKNQSNIFLFRDGMVEDVLYISKQIINLADVTRFLIKNEVIEND